jgi:phosphohistidine swiveling domain-containing protein
MTEQPGLIDLGEYFPGPVPRLVANLWTLALEQAFCIEVRNYDGHLFAAGELSLRPTMPPEIHSAESAALYWRENVEPELERQVAALRVQDLATPEAAARVLARRWLEFHRWYFLNPAANWVERARNMADQRPDLNGRGRRIRKRQRLLAKIAFLRSHESTGSLAAARLFHEYLDEFGAYSAHPESLAGPYPRDEPSLVERELALVGRRPEAADYDLSVFRPDSSQPDPMTGWPELLAIAEDDNHYKYEACYAAHWSIRAIGKLLVCIDRIAVPDEVWHLSLAELAGQTYDFASPTPAERADPGSAPRQRQSRESSFIVCGQQVVSGVATGLAWTVSGDADPPDDDVILVTEGLGSIQAGSLLPYARGLVARHGGATSHCALIAREISRPVVVVGDGIDEMLDGDRLTLQADGIVLVEPHAESMHIGKDG